MWTRSDLKNQAKFNLRGKYWMAFAVSLIVGLLGGGSKFSYQFGSNDFKNVQDKGYFKDFDSFQNYDFSKIIDELKGFFSSGIFLIALVVGVFAIFIALAFQIFVSTVVQVGGWRWFSRSREAAATPTIGQVFSLFKAGSYLKTVGSMLWMNLFLFLWGLLAMVPTIVGGVYLFSQMIDLKAIGQLFQDFRIYNDPMTYMDDFVAFMQQIFPYFFLVTVISLLCSIPLYIKTYSYRMTPWILADNPQIGFRRALQLSMALTRGHKLKMWVLDLSFIGWYMLGVIACGIGVLFVIPYYNAVQAELFATLRQNGVSSGLCTMEEFGYVKVDQNDQPASIPAAY